MTSIPAEFQVHFAPFMAAAPVDVLGCARAIGVPVYAQDLPVGISGMLVREDPLAGDSGFVCYVDEGEANVRQRFTAAHELGHFALHRNEIGRALEDNYLLRAPGLSNYQETQANAFAADLLMPRDLIERYVAEGMTNVTELARTFNVSQVAMAIRLGLPT